MISHNKNFSRRAGSLLMVGTMLGGVPAALSAQAADPLAPPPVEQGAAQRPIGAPAAEQVVQSIRVTGSQRLEPETIRAYANLSVGQTYTASTLDQALKDLYATQLFADVTITGANSGNLIIAVKENPVINRIILEGNKRLKDDKISPEIKLAPRQIFTRSAVRSDVDRILELYRRQGRFAARVEPKIVQLDQNRVDVVFEIYEGDLAKVRAINILGNQAFGDGRLQKEMYTKEAGGLLGFFKSNDTYDPDRLAADQQKLRAFYLTQGYADFRVVSALAELTPDRRDFVITYVIEEGARYKFGTVEADSALRDLPNQQVVGLVKVVPGTWFNAKKIEDAVTDVEEAAGNLGYAFADVGPAYDRDSEKRLMNVKVKVGQTPRVYVERIDITGNTTTRDKVIRREFRVNEGDAFNALKLKRSKDRIQSLGFFQEDLEIKQTEGSAADRIVLAVNVEEKATGQLQFSGGYSSLERFVIQLGLSENNFMGKGQQLDASVNYSRYSKSIQLGFVDPYFLDKQILLGGQIYRRDYKSFNFVGGSRETTYQQNSTGGGLRTGFPLTEFWSVGGRYNLVQDKVTLNKATFFTNGVCDPLKAGQYLCDELGSRVTSSIGYSVLFDNTDGIRPTRGQRFSLSQDFAGLGGDVRYLRTTANGTKFKGFGGGFVLSLHAEGGLIVPLQKAPGEFRDAIRLTDRFFGPQLRGFDIRGIGPRVNRIPYNEDGTLNTSDAQTQNAIGGRAFYMGRAELELPTNSTLRGAGIRPSAFIDVGSLWKITPPRLTNVVAVCIPVADNTTGLPFQILPDSPVQSCGATSGPSGFTRAPGSKEVFLGDSPRPRLSVGIGFNWISPFGPIRIDIAKALLKQDGDDTKFFSFNVGTSF
ncbi:MAG: outer membrane protein assembly factor BamA [Sphingomicrobium sp.]